jgi:arsenate reductase
MADVTIYHNPACGTSRNTLALLRHAGIEPIVVEYLEDAAIEGEAARAVERDGDVGPRAAEEEGNAHDELQLGDPKWTDDELLDAMLRTPILINRPIVVTPLAPSFAGPRRRCSKSCRQPSLRPSSRKTATSSKTRASVAHRRSSA